jgi:hypothetical protein
LETIYVVAVAVVFVAVAVAVGRQWYASVRRRPCVHGPGRGMAGVGFVPLGELPNNHQAGGSRSSGGVHSVASKLSRTRAISRGAGEGRKEIEGQAAEKERHGVARVCCG